MKTFCMYRGNDESGVSGTGCVLEGVIFDTGECVIRWRGTHGSVNIYRTYIDFKTIHVVSHPTNQTHIEFSDGTAEDC